jgi:hypothetical protein
MLQPPLGFVTALVRYAEQVDDVAVLIDLRDTLFERIQSGEGKVLVSASANGKAYNFWLSMTVEQQFTAVVKAIDLYNAEEGSSPITFPDFSGNF